MPQPNLNDSTTCESDLDLLKSMIAAYLNTHPVCSEHDIICWLRAPEQGYFAADALSDSLMLFRTHFLVMHCLYTLRQQWSEQRRGWLDISPLKIQCLPSADTPASNQLAEPDPLSAYYLDLEELNTEQSEVDALLTDFWKRMLRPVDRSQDLEALELETDAGAEQIKRQYRRLANAHHPDKGGDPERFREITAAYQRLKQQA